MRVKVFVGNGLDGIMALENDMNQWLAEQPEDFSLHHTDTAACTVADDAESDRYQSFIVSIWYETGSA